MANFQYSKAGMAFTEREEGLRLASYQDSAGVWTIGYGHTGPDVSAGMTWTPSQAQAALTRDLAWAERVVNVFVRCRLTQAEFDALVDFCYNVGYKAFVDSTLVKLLNRGNIEEAAKQFALWDRAGGQIVAGLLRRRLEETQIFEKDIAQEEK